MIIENQDIDEKSLLDKLKKIGTGSQYIDIGSKFDDLSMMKNDISQSTSSPSININIKHTDSLKSSSQATIDYPFGNYIIKVIVSKSNEFLGIKEVSYSKEYKKKLKSNIIFQDVNKFYKE